MFLRSSLNKVRTSPTKANLVAKMVRNKKALDMAEALRFTRKRAAVDIRKLILSGISNAENNYGIDIDNLYIKELYVGKSMVLKRMRCRAKGRGSRIEKKFSNIYLVLSDNEGGE